MWLVRWRQRPAAIEQGAALALEGSGPCGRHPRTSWPRSRSQRSPSTTCWDRAGQCSRDSEPSGRRANQFYAGVPSWETILAPLNLSLIAQTHVIATETLPMKQKASHTPGARHVWDAAARQFQFIRTIPPAHYIRHWQG